MSETSNQLHEDSRGSSNAQNMVLKVPKIRTYNPFIFWAGEQYPRSFKFKPTIDYDFHNPGHYVLTLMEISN